MATRTATPLESFDQYPDSAGVRVPTAGSVLGCSDATIWRLIKAGRLQKRKVTPRVSVIIVGSIRALLNGGVSK